MHVGIEAINIYGGLAYIDVKTIFEKRGLDLERFNNLMMKKKTVGLPCEDAITYAVNAAKPIIDNLSPEEKDKIEMVITGSESAIDVGKSLSTYVHDYLKLNRNCRLMELKQCCYSGTGALQMASCFIASQASPGAKALVLASDSLPNLKNTYAEPSTGLGAVAMLVSAKPEILELDFGANGYYGYEVMDFVRPTPTCEYANIDLTIFSYLDCVENSYKNYRKRIKDVDYQKTFDYLAFHTPFAGMVKGAHRKMMRSMYPQLLPNLIEEDFLKRVNPSLSYCAEVGNIAGGSLYLALCGIIDSVQIQEMKRVGLFSYGSGCASEFYSGTITPKSQEVLSQMKIREKLDNRYKLNFEEYDKLLDLYAEWIIPEENKEVDFAAYHTIYEHSLQGKGLLILKGIRKYHREYAWS
ncbi:Polyketide biosynthesis 3-hydroxy-3-methylglutaryl-ACP synthase PksG [Gammaproteobacteria bacterium]